MHEGFSKVAYVSLAEDGRWKVSYLSYATGQPTLQEAVGTHLESLISGLKKNKQKFLENLDEREE